MRECPKCRAPWEPNRAGGCLHCGWTKGEGGKGAPKTPWSGHDGLCQFEYSGRRCQLPGNILEAGKWYCGHHVDPTNRGNGPDQHEHFRIFDRSTEQGRACIRDWLTDRYGDTTKHMARDIAKQHPEWSRQPREPESEYQRRMIATAKNLGLPPSIPSQEAAE